VPSFSSNLDIIVKVLGGTPAASELKGVAAAEMEIGTAAQATSKKTSALRSSLLGIGKGLLVFQGLRFAAQGVTQVEQLSKATASLQRVTGMDTKTASGWVGVAKERGIQSKQLNMGFITLARQMQAARKGTAASVDAFSALGVSQKQLAGLGTDQAVSRISDAFARMPNGAQKAALAQKLFGRSAQGLLPLLNSGSKALGEQVGEMARNLGFTDKTVKQNLKWAAQQRQLNELVLGLKVAVGSALIPVLSQLATTFAPILTGFAALLRSSPALRIAVVLLVPALWALNAALDANPIVLAVGAVAALTLALIAAYTKVKWFHNAVDAAWSFIKTHWPLLLSILTGPIGAATIFIVRHFNSIKGAAVDAWHWIENAFNNVVTFVAKLPGRIASVGRGMWNGIRQGFADAIAWIMQAWNSFASKLSIDVGPIHVHAPTFSGASVATTQFGRSPTQATGGGLGAPPILTARQRGGLVGTGGELALVGERGPEIVGLPAGAFVYPNRGGMPLRVHTAVMIDGREVARAVSDHVATRQASR
jgi:hypothetical protein